MCAGIMNMDDCNDDDDVNVAYNDDDYKDDDNHDDNHNDGGTEKILLYRAFNSSVCLSVCPVLFS